MWNMFCLDDLSRISQKKKKDKKDGRGKKNQINELIHKIRNNQLNRTTQIRYLKALNNQLCIDTLSNSNNLNL